MSRSERDLWLSVAGVSFAEGTVYAFRDRTEERRLEELKTDFIATVSHELRTPIAAVHGAALTLARDDVVFTDDLRRRLLSVISDQSERLAHLVNDILLTSQVESGRLVLASEQVDVSELARRAIEAGRACPGTHAGTRGITKSCPGDRRPRQAPAGAREPRGQRNQVLTGQRPDRGRLESRENGLRIAVRDEGSVFRSPSSNESSRSSTAFRRRSTQSVVPASVSTSAASWSVVWEEVSGSSPSRGWVRHSS